MTYAASIPAWAQQITTLPGPCTGARMSRLCDTVALARVVYGKDEDDNTGLIAFAYLWRRFGPPWWGSDPHKELVGYILGTPHPDVLLTVRPSGSGLCLCMGYLLTKALERELYEPMTAWNTAFEHWWVEHYTESEEQRILCADEDGLNTSERAILETVRTRYAEASFSGKKHAEATQILGRMPFPDDHPTVCEPITAAMVELLRPVWIRDVPITILGRVDDVDERETCDESPYAGYGVPQEAMKAQLKED